MSFLYIYECSLQVLCNRVVRKVKYMWENSCREGSNLSCVRVLVFHMYLLSYLLSSLCIWWSSMFVIRTICKLFKFKGNVSIGFCCL